MELKKRMTWQTWQTKENQQQQQHRRVGMILMQVHHLQLMPEAMLEPDALQPGRQPELSRCGGTIQHSSSSSSWQARIPTLENAAVTAGAVNTDVVADERAQGKLCGRH